MNRASLDKHLERGILAVILAILVFAPLALGATGPAQFLAIQALMVAVLLLWGLRIWTNPASRFFWPPVCWVVLAFALYALARYFTADIEYVARREMIQTVMFAFLFFAIVNNLSSRETPQIIGFTMIFLAAGISCYALWQFLTHSNRVWNVLSPYGGRASGTYISPDDFACLLGMLLPLALAYFLAGPVKPGARVLLAYALLAMGAGEAVTFSRGGWLAALAGIGAVLVFLICQRKFRIPALVLAGALLAGGTVFVATCLSHAPGYIQRIEQASSGGNLNENTRLALWSAAERMWAEHFWLGVGPGHYDYRFGQYRPETVQVRPVYAHNDYLNLLADWGCVGAGIVAAGLVLFALSLGKTWKVLRPDNNHLGQRSGNRFAFLLGASAGLLALAVHSLVNFNLHTPANAILGVTLLALLSGQLRYATSRFGFDANSRAKILATAALAGGIFYFSAQGVRLVRELTWLARAQDARLLVLDRAALLEKAFNAEPKNFHIAYDIGEFYRIQSFQGGQDYETLAQTAIRWYSRSMNLDRFDSFNYLRYGMCLDWMDKHDEAGKFYSRAEGLDPNNSFVVANIGWHYVQTGDYAAARQCLERSLRLEPNANAIGHSYLEIVEKGLAEEASGQGILPRGG